MMLMRTGISRIIHLPKNQQGLSLIELMISLLMSLFILAGLVTVFSLNRATYQTDEGMARLQENGRFALDFLTRDIRSAGTIGCTGINQLKPGKNSEGVITNLNKTPTFASVADLSTPIVGYDATAITAVTTTYPLPMLYPPVMTGVTTPALPALLAPGTGVVVGSDAMQIVAMDPDYTQIVSLPTLNTPVIPKDSSIDNGDLIVATACDPSTPPAVATVLSSTPSGLYRTLTLDYPLPTNLSTDPNKLVVSQIAKIRTLLYYIGPGANGGPSLFVRNFSDAVGTPQELVEGIENLQIQYGIQDSTCVAGTYRNACEYQSAATVANPKQIRSVKIGLLVATSNVVTGRDSSPTANSGAADTGFDNNTYTMQGINFIPNADRHRRHAFETTIQIRNLGINSR